jgi:hypothetical protein
MVAKDNPAATAAPRLNPSDWLGDRPIFVANVSLLPKVLHKNFQDGCWENSMNTFGIDLYNG